MTIESKPKVIPKRSHVLFGVIVLGIAIVVFLHIFLPYRLSVYRPGFDIASFRNCVGKSDTELLAAFDYPLIVDGHSMHMILKDPRMAAGLAQRKTSVFLILGDDGTYRRPTPRNTESFYNIVGIFEDILAELRARERRWLTPLRLLPEMHRKESRKERWYYAVPTTESPLSRFFRVFAMAELLDGKVLDVTVHVDRDYGRMMRSAVNSILFPSSRGRVMSSPTPRP